MVAFGGLLVHRLAEEARDEARERLVEEVRAVAAAMDRKLLQATAGLEVLAQSDDLDRGDLAQFLREARKLDAYRDEWVGVTLVAPDGVRVLDTRAPSGAVLRPERDDDAVRAVSAQLAPAIGDLQLDPQLGPAFAVHVPVLRAGQLTYVLSTLISASTVERAIGLGDREWTRAVLDGKGRLVVRTRDPGRFVGRYATGELLNRLRQGAEGFFPSVTLDGQPSYVAYHRSALSGWTCTVAVQRDRLDAPVRRAIATALALGAALLVLAGAGAFLLSRRLTRARAAATRDADALASGAQPTAAPTGVAEVDHLGEALRRSGELLAARGAERDELLARAEAARGEAEHASRAKDEFLAMLGHELRNPLSPIVTALQLLRLRGEGDTREHLVIDRHVTHLSRLVDDLLDVARITRGKIALERSVVEVGLVVQKAVEMASPLLEGRQHRLALDVPAGLTVQGDPIRLAQVLSNLLTNAARYTPPGGHVAVRVRRDGEALVIAVEDDGQGIPPELLERIFDLFVQGPRASDRLGGGLGLGLALVRNLVELHGGTVSAHSPGSGQGSTFTVRLPAAGAPACAGEASPPAALATVLPRPGRGRRVLVVDDNEDFAELLADLLATEGHEVLQVHDGPAALRAVEAFRPEVAVLDVGLPVMDGFELSQRLAERLGPEAPAVLGVSGYGQAPDLARARSAGFQRLLVKPADPATVLRLVEELARERDARVTGSSPPLAGPVDARPFTG